MDVYRVAAVMRGIGADQVSVAGDRVRCACVLARWTHPKGRDSNPSMVVFHTGKYGVPIYSCLACHESGSLRDLLCDLWSLTGVDHYHWIEIVDNETADVSVAEAKSKRERAARLAEKANGSFVARPDYARKALVKEVGPSRFDPNTSAKPFYDFRAASKSDDLPEIPWEHYAAHAGHVPRYAIDPPPDGRGLTLDTCRAWELGHDRKMRRLLFPIRDRKGRLVAISGRLYECRKCGLKPPETVSPNVCTRCGHVVYGTVEPDESCHVCGHHDLKRQRAVCARCHERASPKYLHSKGFKRNLLLYGEHRHKVDRTDGRVYLVEGNVDVLSMWQAGYRPVCATLGSNPGEEQVEKLIRDHERIIVVGDGDESGVKFAQHVKKMVAQRIPVATKKLPPKMDPNQLGAEGLLPILGEPPFAVDSTHPTG